MGAGAGADRGRRAERGEAVTRVRFAFLSIVIASIALAPMARAAQNLDELLEQTRNAHEKEKKESADRERVFQASRDQQAFLLNEAEQQRKTEDAYSHQLSAQYDANDKEINQIKVQTDEGQRLMLSLDAASLARLQVGAPCLLQVAPQSTRESARPPEQEEAFW